MNNAKQQYKNAVHAYCEEFYENYFCEKEEKSEYYCKYRPTLWVGQETGGILAVNGCDIYLNFDDIRKIVDNKIPVDDWTEWFYWQLEDTEKNRTNVDVWYKLNKK